MTLAVFDKLEQRSPEWYEQRRGIVTASVVGGLIATRRLTAIDYECPECAAPANDPCRGKRDPSQPIKTLHTERAAVAKNTASPIVLETASNDVSRSITTRLVAERITGWVEESYTSEAMWRGILDEPIARDKYREHHAPVDEVGFMVRDDWGIKIGCSPDGLVGDDGMIEIKSRAPKNQVDTVLGGHPPADNMPQLQAALLVSGREWVDYISFAGGMHLWTKRVYPDPKWFDAIVAAVRTFEANAQEMQWQYMEAVEGLPMTERTILNLNPDVDLEAS